MKSNALWGIVLLIIIILGVAAWVVLGEPSYVPNTATTTPQENTDDTDDTSGEQTGPPTVEQLKARVAVDAPESGANVPQSFSVTGTAPGPWFFEASFPIEVRDANGTVLTTGIATALSDWMTIDDVAFKADITVTGYSGPATLVLKRDNASGLPEHDASVSIPITIE